MDSYNLTRPQTSQVTNGQGLGVVQLYSTRFNPMWRSDVKDLYTHITRNDIDRYTNGTSDNVREMQIKATVRHHYTLTRTTKQQNKTRQVQTRIRRNWNLLISLMGMWNDTATFGKFGSSLKKLNINLLASTSNSSHQLNRKKYTQSLERECSQQF